MDNDNNNSNKQKNLLCTDFHAFYLQIRNMGWEYFNDTHMEELVLYWIQYKNSLKYKIGCFWRFSYVYTVN